MFLDVVVLAGIGTVGLMIVFGVGFTYFVWKDASRKKPL
ncbi:cytochrome c oxidase subunit CcoM [Pseudomonas sp. WHRI 8822A]